MYKTQLVSLGSNQEEFEESNPHKCKAQFASRIQNKTATATAHQFIRSSSDNSHIIKPPSQPPTLATSLQAINQRSKTSKSSTKVSMSSSSKYHLHIQQNSMCRAHLQVQQDIKSHLQVSIKSQRTIVKNPPKQQALQIYQSRTRASQSKLQKAKSSNVILQNLSKPKQRLQSMHITLLLLFSQALVNLFQSEQVLANVLQVIANLILLEMRIGQVYIQGSKGKQDSAILRVGFKVVQARVQVGLGRRNSFTVKLKVRVGQRQVGLRFYKEQGKRNV